MPTWLTLPDVSAHDPPVPPHVVLVGLAGAGKSTVARALGAALHRPVLEFDREIEARTGSSVAELFAAHGETTFRRLERELTAEVAAWAGGLIVDPGGGWIANAGALELLRPPARLVWLKVEPREALRRLGPAAATRPLLRHPDPLGALEAQLLERAGRYAVADFAVNSQSGPPATLVTRILAQTARWKDVSA